MKTVRISLLGWLTGAAIACAGTEKIEVDKAEQLIGEKVQLLDVRTEEEWNEGHLEGALRVDFTAEGFAEGVRKALDQDRPVLVYCRSGNRSARAAKVMEQLGFQTVYDLKGGITGWQKAGKKVVR